MATDPRTSLSSYINPFDRAKGFQRLAYHYDRFLAGHELNVQQDIEADRVKQICDAMWKDGYLTWGGTIVLGTIANNLVPVNLAAARVYIRGAIHDIEARTISVPATGTVFVGIRLRSYTITHEDDATLKGLAPSTRAEGEPTASAWVMKGRWGWNGDGEDGDFFPIYTIKDGVIETTEQTIDDSWLNLLARYDREAHGGYVVEGFKVQALGFDGTHQVYTVSEGTINVWGFKRTRPASYRMRILEEPDIQLIDDEPHAVNSGSQTIAVRFGPIAEVVEVTIIAEKTVTLTHGAYSGCTDALPDPTVLSISEVKQSSTTYAATTDYKLSGAAVDWSPSGSEPSPGSTYTVTYRYLTNVSPTNVERATFDITGAADGTVCYVKYKTKLPRYDAIVVDQTGAISYVKGISSLYAPQNVVVASTLVKLADVVNNWGLMPTVKQVGTIRMPFSDQRDLESMVGDLYALVAEERLQRDVDRKEVSSKRGVFVDPFLDDDMRDQGIAQSGAIFSGYLWLPVTPTVTTVSFAANNIDFSEDYVFQQTKITGSSRINPYQVFDPPATQVTLDPAVDLWTEVVDLWTSIATQRSTGSGNSFSVSTAIQEKVLSATTEEIETIRTRNVAYTVKMWGPHEKLVKVTFDDIDVSPVAEVRADEDGTVTGSFAIPAGVPCGVKNVAFTGLAGSTANALYTAYGWKTTTTHERNTITTYSYFNWNIDPVAQTFRLSEPRQISGVDLKFTAVGDRSNPVRVQLREVELGVPTETVVAEALIDMTAVPVIDVLSTSARSESDWTAVDFGYPVTLREDRNYAITVLTSDGYHSVAIADLGGFDQIEGWVTSNAFPNGTFLDGSDGRSWLAKPGRSLVFRLRGAVYGSTAQVSKTIDCGAVAVTNCSDLMPLIVSERPENTAIEIEFVAPSGAVYTTGPAVDVQLPATITGNVAVRVKLIGTPHLSPLVMGYVQVVAGAIQAEGDYISRAFTCGSDAKVRQIVDVYLPSTGTYAAYVQTGVASGLPVWSAMTLETATSLGDGWEERQYVYDHLTIAETRIKGVLTGGPGARSRGKSMRGVAVPSTTGA